MLAVAMSFAACQEVEAPLAEENVLSAVIEQDETTKTEMDENNNILWSANDQIVAFMKSSYGHKYNLIPSYIGKAYADFEPASSGNGGNLSAGSEWDHNVAYYPYSSSVECLRSGNHYTLEVVLPSEQTYVPESFSNGSMAMVAVSEDNNIVFKNVLGGMKLQLKGTQKVTSIKLQGKNNEKLSGEATVTAYTDETSPTITMASEASTSVTLNCGSGVQLNASKATEFIISLPPVLFSKGFTVTLTDNSGNTYTVETDNANTVLRSSLLRMPAFKLGDKPEEDSNGEVLVNKIFIDRTSLTMVPNTSYTFEAEVDPYYATDKTLTWSSSAPSVVSIDQSGKATALSEGTAVISAVAVGGTSASCDVNVLACSAVADIDYIDEYGVNCGKGIAIGETVWAPVNLGTYYDNYEAFDNPNSVTNMWHDANIDVTLWFSDNNWTQIPDPEMTVKNGEYSIVIPEDMGQREWQGQVIFNNTGLVLNSHKSYFFGVVLNSSSDQSGITIKPCYEDPTQEDINELFHENSLGLWADTDYRYLQFVLPGKDIPNLKLLFDFGGCVPGSTITIKDIVLGERTAHSYGMLYQWGRKYGQGWANDSFYDSRTAVIVDGSVMPSVGQSIDRKDEFFCDDSDWNKIPDDGLWNKGTESEPIKTEFDPCPKGWRVPTYTELNALCQNHSEWSEGNKGYFFSGEYTYMENAPRVFLPAAGYRDGSDGETSYLRDEYGCYWSSGHSYNGTYRLYFNNADIRVSATENRADGFYVRCVQE